MSRESEIWFGKLCEESLTRQFNRELEAYTGDVKCSRRHYRRISKIIGIRVRPPRRPMSGKVIAVLVAAAVLLLSIGATVLAYWNCIKGFLIETFGEYLTLRSDVAATSGDQPDRIEDVYTLTYVPEGYVLKEERVGLKMVFYQWENDKKEIIDYTQQITGASAYIDSKEAEFEVWAINDKNIYWKNAEDSNFYMWQDGSYYHSLRVGSEMTQEEVAKIIAGMVLQ